MSSKTNTADRAGNSGSRGPAALLLSRYFESLITFGSLAVEFADGTRKRFGEATPELAEVAVRFADERVPREILLDPALGAGW